MRTTLKAYLYHAAFLAGSYFFLRFLMPYLLPFVLALFFALLVDTPVTWLERRWRLPRGLAAAVVILLVLGGLGLVGATGAMRLGAELVALSASLPDLFQRLSGAATALVELLGEFSATLPPLLKQGVDQQIALVYRLAQAAVTALLTTVQGWVVALPGAVLVFLLTALATYFFSRDKAAIRDFLLALVPRPLRAGALEVKDRLLVSTVGLIKAQTVLVTITFFVFLLGLSLLRVPYALLVALLSSLLDLLPVLGPSLIYIPWAAYAFLDGRPGLAVGLLVLYGAVALVRGGLQASVIGARMGLHPLVTLVALYVGAALFGPVGVVYGPLVAALWRAAVAAGLLPRPGEDGAR